MRVLFVSMCVCRCVCSVLVMLFFSGFDGIM